MDPRAFCREPGFGSALLLTYSFDALFFERLVLRDLWAGGSGDVTVLADGSEIDAALPHWAGQLRHLGRRFKLGVAQARGAFHPKMILRIGDAHGAVWIGSGNITFGGWGGNREAAAAWKLGPGQADSGDWVADLLESASSWAPLGSARSGIERLRETSWVRAAQSTATTAPSPVIFSSGARSLSSLLEERWSGRRFDEVKILTGSTDESGECLRWLARAFGITRATVAVDSDRCGFVADSLAGLDVELRLVELETAAPLHAKWYWLDGPGGSACILGSANCSAAAWLLPPQNGGNIEAIAPYDSVDQEGADSILSELGIAGEIEVPRARRADSLEPSDSEGRPRIEDLVWDPGSALLELSLDRSLPDGSRIAIEIEGSEGTIAAASEDGRCWVCTLETLPLEGGSSFTRVLIKSGATSWALTHWITNRLELDHASRGRRVADSLGALATPRGPSEQKRIVAELHRIGISLLTTTHTSTSSVSRRARRDNDEQPQSVEPVNPDDLVRSLADVEARERGPLGGAGVSGLSLVGVIRALFGDDASDDENDDFDEKSEPGSKPSTEESKKGKKADGGGETAPRQPVRDSYRKRLASHMKEYLVALASEDFGQAATGPQLVEAAAYPLAVAALGRRGGWVEGDQETAWVDRVLDLLLRKTFSDGSTGLLERAQAASIERGEEDEFLRNVSDGTLWIALLHAVSRCAWNGPTATLEKALAVRSIYRSAALLASSDLGRMRGLLRGGDVSRARSVLELAPGLSQALEGLETYLETHWEQLLKVQSESCEEGALFWRSNPGWGVAEEAAATGRNLRMRLVSRAGVQRVKPSYFLNVTDLARQDPTLGSLISRMNES